MKSARIISLASIALALAGCGASQLSAFGYHFADNQEDDLGTVLAELPAPAADDRPQNSLGEPIGVASTHADSDAERQLVAFRVESGEQLWTAPFDAATRPEILGDVVLSTTREELVAFDLQSGRVLWRRDLPDLAYVGATRDGGTIYWAATVGALGGARRVGHVVAVGARNGDELWRHEVQGVFGKPAAAGGFVFVPWERQNVAILDGETGIERARLRSTDDVIAWAFDHPSGIYYGGRGIYRLTERSATGTREGSTHVRPPLGELPRQPESIWPDGFLPEPGTRSARGRIRVYFDPAPSPDAESIPVEGDTYYFAYYRYVFAFDLEGNLRWTRILEQDVINAEVTQSGLLAVGEQGALRLLDRETGNDRWSHDLGMQLASVDLDAAGFAPAGEAGEARTLRTSLNELVLDPDNRLVPARGYAIARLAQIEEAEVTRDLLDLYQQRSMPGALKEAIREALRTRRTGQEFLMEALARRYDYLEDTQAPPLEAIVPALLEMEHAEAVPRLINHMMDHETPAAVLPQVVDAVVRLGGVEVVPALRNFLVLYQADSTFVGPVADAPPAEEGGEPTRATPEAQALAIAAAGIFQHGGPEGRELLAALSGEGSRTHDPVAEHITGLYAAEQRAEAERAAQEEAAAQAALLEQQRREEAALPPRLSQEQINQTFAENADPLRECIAGEIERNPRLSQVRMVFILSNDGQASELTVSPNTPELVECMQERVAAIRFPRFQQRRMRGAFTVSIRGGAEPASEEPGVAPLPDDAPWWAWTQRRAELRGDASSVPAVAAWWAEREAPVQAAPEPAVVVEEPELPPGMVLQQQQQQQAQQRQQQQQQQQQPTESAQESGGTPWWAAAQSEEAEEEAQEEEEEEEEQPRRRPRGRRQR